MQHFKSGTASVQSSGSEEVLQLSQVRPLNDEHLDLQSVLEVFSVGLRPEATLFCG